MKIFRHSFFAMGSGCEVVLAAQDTAQAHSMAQSVIEEVSRIEKKYSRYRPDSVIAEINQNAGQRETACDDETWSLLNYADQLYQSSQGLFDITSGVLRRAWNFQEKRVPSEEALARLLPLVNWPAVARHHQTIALPTEGMEIDLGGFGKEYAADRAGHLLRSMGVMNGYVNLAGDMHFVGPKPDGSPWLIGIRDPRREGQLVATIPMHQGGLATSGDYERYFEINGQRYCHILNPKTGMPVRAWQSVSVVAPLAVVAGSATTITMLKEQTGQSYLETGHFPYFCVDATGQTLSSELAAPATERHS